MLLRTKELFFIFFLSLCLFSMSVCGQNRAADTVIVVTDTTNLDILFKKARDLSSDENYSQARRVCLKILEKKPNYYDVRTFIGRTYAWEKQYDNARTEFSRVLIEHETDYEALNALIDVEFWTENYEVSSDYLRLALGYYPNSEELLLKKAKLQLKLEDKENAALTLRRILDLNSGHKEAQRLMNSLEGKRRLNNNFQVGYLVDLFDKRKKAQNLYTAEIGRYFNFGSLTMRGNAGKKFDRKAFQYEVESYLHFTKSTYANLLAGFSTSTVVFPKDKYNAELYQKLGRGFEFSLGARYLGFTKGTVLYTSSLSKYYKDYWFSLRTFVNPKTDSVVTSASLETTSVTVIANIRTYFGDSDNYMGVKLGRGQSPDENETLDFGIQNLSYQAGIELQRRAFARWLIKADVTYARENILNTRYNQRITSNVTLKTVF
jgi:YaiO family outer membrane protein